MPDTLIEKLTLEETMIDAEKELLTQGAAALPVLISILNGTAKNPFGTAYRDLGLPLRCAIEIASRLGPRAKPIEGLITQELLKGSSKAANALGYLGSLEVSTIVALAASLNSHDNALALEAAAALIRSGNAEHLEVMRMTAQSEQAEKRMALAKRHSAPMV